MNDNQKISWYQTFHKFQLSRERTWQPKINTALKNQIKPVITHLKQYGIQSTISHLEALVPFDEMAKIIQNIYIDAGTVFGGKAYQLVKKQKKASGVKAMHDFLFNDTYPKKIIEVPYTTKGMMPIGYNEELIQEIIQY